MPDRVALAGIIYDLRKGVAWRDVPSEVVGCSGVTAWRDCGTGPRPVSGLACTRHSSPSCGQQARWTWTMLRSTAPT